MSDAGYGISVYNFKTGQTDQLEAIGGNLYSDQKPPRTPVNLAHYVPQDPEAQNLLMALQARQYCAAHPREHVTPLDMLVEVLKCTAQRPVQGNAP